MRPDLTSGNRPDRTKNRRILFSIWQWKPGTKNLMEILFFIKARPNFWPQIENRLWVVLALNKTTRGP